MSFSHSGVLARRLASAGVDWAIEFGGGLLGSYFGAVTAALWMALKNEPAEMMQSSMWHGLGFGFVFWGISVSFINRVLIQGVSRASIGKKIFKLELISSAGPITWNTVVKRWVMSYASFAAAGLGYVYAVFEEHGRTFHDLISHTDVVPAFKSATMSVEYREQPVVMPGLRTQEFSKMIVLASANSERPMATVFHLPIKTEPMPSFQVAPVESAVGSNNNLAEVIEMNPAEDGEDKKAA